MLDLIQRAVTTFQNNVVYDLLSYFLGMAILLVAIPSVIDYRQFRKQLPIRRMIASRISRVHLTLERYISFIAEHPDKTNVKYQRYLDDYKNAIHHMMDVPRHFSIALGGNVGSAYYNYRVLATNVGATAARAVGDYDTFFENIFFTNAIIPPSSIREVHEQYMKCLEIFGKDINTIETMQPVVSSWSEKLVGELESSYAQIRET